MADILAYGDGTLMAGGRRFACALGKGGLSDDKKEGDGATPIGCFALRRVLYRADRLDAPKTALPTQEIRAPDGWCDDPWSAFYNRPVQFPFDGSAERLFREDHLYDIVVVLGHNDDPPVPFAGSAIFLHLARPDYGPTEGCVALAPQDLAAVLAGAAPGDRLCVRPGVSPA